MPVAADRWAIWGTTATLLTSNPGSIGLARRIVDDELDSIDRAASRFRVDSELARVNREAGEPTPVSPVLFALLAAALRAARLTDGDVDPTVGAALVTAGYDRDLDLVRARPSAGPERPARIRIRPRPTWRDVVLDADSRTVRIPPGATLDLGATAKALAADRAAGAVRRAVGAGCGVLVNLGGDIAVADEVPDRGWTVRVAEDHRGDPRPGDPTVAVRAGGLATSSTRVRRWRRGSRELHHIFDPGTDRPAREVWRTVTVAADTCVDANTASTAAIVRGASAPAWLIAAGLPARLVASDGRVVTVCGWPTGDPRA
ncbi:MAG: FAD:protein transferase [Solirubrobacteraceae bacterium]|nr:FAD:protein transferase [Solirubrobacteraceae bacterium]